MLNETYVTFYAFCNFVTNQKIRSQLPSYIPIPSDVFDSDRKSNLDMTLGFGRRIDACQTNYL